MLLEGIVIGLVEDDLIVGESLVQSLTLEGGKVYWWKTKADAEASLRRSKPDLVVCDIRLPDGRGDELFLELALTESLPPFLFITAFGDIDQAINVLKAGAGDYVTKPFDIVNFIDRAKALVSKRKQVRSDHVLGQSDQMINIEDTIRRICDLRSPVLISGETGTGKEICARFLHSISFHSKEPFIVVNCAAIPPDVIDRELFGSRGNSSQSFHHGFAERTRNGVLFLDEISELPITLQAKLLRLVEAREFYRVCGEQVMSFHGRIICSTNRDLSHLVKQKLFRDDLLFLINSMTIDLPALRDRPTDIPWLIDHYLGQFSGDEKNNLRGVSTLTYEVALAYPWPGNIRELRNRMGRALAMTKTEWIMPSDLFPDFVSTKQNESSRFATLSEVRDNAEKRQIERALKETDGQIQEAANLLGISRTTLWDRMRRFKIVV